GERVGVGIVLAEMFELADIDLADERGDVLVVFIARLGLGDGVLAQLGGENLRDFELRDVASEFVQSFYRPGTHHATDAVALDPIALGKQITELDGAEETQRALEYRADRVARLEHVDWIFFHHILEPLGKRRLAATDRAEEIKNLPLLLETLGGVLEVAHNALDRVFHPIEAVESAIGLDRAVGEKAGEARILRGVDQLGLTDRGDHALGRR